MHRLWMRVRRIAESTGMDRNDPGDPSAKIVPIDELTRRRAAARGQGRRVVMCHGCFDIVHPGHIRHLRQARSMGDLLLVSITGDRHIGKGAGRPLIPQELRAENLAALDLVDWVHIDDHPTALELLRSVEPDIYIKGREYEANSDPRFRAERETVEAGGGRVVFSSGDVVFSSTALIGTLEHAADPFHARLTGLLGEQELSEARLDALVGSFRGKRVTVVGEPIIDSYVLCDRPDVAGESPIMTLRPLETRRFDGGAAIIARHAASMGAAATLVTALPDTAKSDELVGRLRAEGVEVLWLPVSGRLPEKQRFTVGGQKVVKIDNFSPFVLDAGQRDALVGLVAAAGSADAAIIADFGLGLLTRATIHAVRDELRKRCGFIAGDVSGRRGDLMAMRGLDLVTPGEHELRAAMHLHDDALPAVASRLLAGGRFAAAGRRRAGCGRTRPNRPSHRDNGPGGRDRLRAHGRDRRTRRGLRHPAQGAPCPLACPRRDRPARLRRCAADHRGPHVGLRWLDAGRDVPRIRCCRDPGPPLRQPARVGHGPPPGDSASAPRESGLRTGRRDRVAALGTRRPQARVMIAYVLPTRDRAERLDATLDRLDAIGGYEAIGGARVIIADNASAEPFRPAAPHRLPITVLRMASNLGAAARNECARAADGCDWLVMLDDDSFPLDVAVLPALRAAPRDVAAIKADITLPDGSRERGGLPEVPVGCGVAIRRKVFLDLGGYDPAFDYYAEEYDLAAKMIAAGHRVAFEPSFCVRHDKVAANRDFGRILSRLVRNNGWVIQRYAPDADLEPFMRSMLDRYRAIAAKENVLASYESAADELSRTLGDQARRPLTDQQWGRFIGLSSARESFAGLRGTAAIIEPGKHADVVAAAARQAGLDLIRAWERADHLLIGTLSPGPMLDAVQRLGRDPRVRAPWRAAERFRPAARPQRAPLKEAV
ncbi:MAG: adenylyltransferase/cytidyltransferase family protein [Planctomycetota bacterium]